MSFPCLPDKFPIWVQTSPHRDNINVHTKFGNAVFLMSSEVSAPGGNVDVEMTVQQNEQTVAKKGFSIGQFPIQEENKVIKEKIYIFSFVCMLNFQIISYKCGLLGI